jgi:hypothetical protein
MSFDAPPALIGQKSRFLQKNKKAMEFTFETFKNNSNDSELSKYIEETCKSVKLDPSKIRELAASSDTTKLKIRSHAESQFYSALGNEKASLNGWIKIAQENLDRAKNEEKSRDEAIKDLAKRGGITTIGKAVVDLPPHMKNKLWLCRGISIVALIIGCVSTFGLLYTQIGWDWWLAAPASLLAVAVFGGAVKIFFDQLSTHGKMWWNVGFYCVFALLIVTGLGFFFFLAQEYGKDILDHQDNKWLRFFLGLTSEIMGAGLAWGYSDKLIRDHTRSDGVGQSQEYEELEKRRKEAETARDLWSSRITLANSMIVTIQSADANLQADAERLFEEVSKTS